MSFAMRGLTHCENCGVALGEHEIGRCTSCQKEYDEEQRKIKINEEIERRVKIELSKLTKKIETFTIQDSEGKKHKITGYWEDNIFHNIK